MTNKFFQENSNSDTSSWTAHREQFHSNIKTGGLDHSLLLKDNVEVSPSPFLPKEEKLNWNSDQPRSHPAPVRCWDNRRTINCRHATTDNGTGDRHRWI